MSGPEAEFHRALFLGKVDMAQTLMSMGVNPTLPDSKGDTIFHHIARFTWEFTPMLEQCRMLSNKMTMLPWLEPYSGLINTPNHYRSIPLNDTLNEYPRCAGRFGDEVLNWIQAFFRMGCQGDANSLDIAIGNLFVTYNQDGYPSGSNLHATEMNIIIFLRAMGVTASTYFDFTTCTPLAPLHDVIEGDATDESPIHFLSQPIPTDTILKMRYAVYFQQSLLNRLVVSI